jgi:hypothetical protein
VASNFRLEDGGKVAILDHHGNVIMSRKNPGEYADVDEGIEAIVTAYPARDSILRTTGAKGSGAQGGDGGGGNGQAEQETVIFEPVTGLENIGYRYQHEYAYTIKVKGFRWDVSGGGANPTDGALGTTTNWDKAATSDKNLAGVRILFN